jgi:hypothetical protein
MRNKTGIFEFQKFKLEHKKKMITLSLILTPIWLQEEEAVPEVVAAVPAKVQLPAHHQKR